MRLFLIASLALAALSVPACPQATSPDRPEPRPYPQAGAAGAPAAGHGGSPGSAGSPSGGAAGYDPGAGGAPGGDQPLCALAPAPTPDPALDTMKAKHAAALADLNYGPLSAWVDHREPWSLTTLAAIAPVGPGWTAAKVEQVRFKMGSGHVEVPQAGCATCGLRNPCTVDGLPRVLGIAFDVAAPVAKARAAPKP